MTCRTDSPAVTWAQQPDGFVADAGDIIPARSKANAAPFALEGSSSKKLMTLAEERILPVNEGRDHNESNCWHKQHKRAAIKNRCC